MKLDILWILGISKALSSGIHYGPQEYEAEGDELGVEKDGGVFRGKLWPGRDCSAIHGGTRDFRFPFA